MLHYMAELRKRQDDGLINLFARHFHDSLRNIWLVAIPLNGRSITTSHYYDKSLCYMFLQKPGWISSWIFLICLLFSLITSVLP